MVFELYEVYLILPTRSWRYELHKLHPQKHAGRNCGWILHHRQLKWNVCVEYFPVERDPPQFGITKNGAKIIYRANPVKAIGIANCHERWNMDCCSR